MKQFNTIWKKLAKENNLRREDFAAYCIMNAMYQILMTQTKYDTSDALKDNDFKEAAYQLSLRLITKAFTPCYNKKRNAHGWPSSKAIELACDLAYMANPALLSCLTDEEYQYFIHIANRIVFEIKYMGIEKYEQHRYVYLFTRKDISKEQVVVQTAHVALELGSLLKKENIPVDNLYFAVCEAENEDDLYSIKESLDGDTNVRYTCFYEPDIGNQLTSIATFPVLSHKRDYFRKYKLLKFKMNVFEKLFQKLKDNDLF